MNSFIYIWPLCSIFFLVHNSVQDSQTIIAPPPMGPSDVEGFVKFYCPSYRRCDDDTFYDNRTFDQNSQIVGCCLQCDCNDMCIVKGNCCPGKTKTPTDSSIRCVQTFTGFRIHPDKYLGSSYLLKFANEENHCNTDMFEKCFLPNTSIIEEMTPVYVNATGINYRNVFCAVCDGMPNDTHIHNWPASLSCEGFGRLDRLRTLLKRNGESIDRIIDHITASDCLVNWQPFEADSAEWCIHSDDVVSKCLDTVDNFSQTDDYYFEHCCSDREEDTLYVPVLQEGWLYRNAMCAASHMTLLPQYMWPLDICHFTKFDFTNSFSILIDAPVYAMPESKSTCISYGTVST